MPVQEFRALVNARADAITACYLGHGFLNGQNYKITIAIDGRITRVRAHEYCPIAPPARDCVLRILRGLPVRNELGEERELTVGLGQRGL